MKNKKLLSVLANIGLSDQESVVYLAALSLGPTTVLKLARATELKRTTIYSLVDALKQKGLMSIEPKGFKQLYVSEDPQKLERVLDARHRDYRACLPELRALYNLRGKDSVVKYYEGLDGVKGVYDSLLSDIQPHEQYLAISNDAQWTKLDEQWFTRYMERRAKLPIEVRLLLQPTEGAKQYQKFQRNFNFEVRLLPEDVNFATSLTITPQRLVSQQLADPVCAVVIENRTMIDTHTQLFEVLWRGAK